MKFTCFVLGVRFVVQLLSLSPVLSPTLRSLLYNIELVFMFSVPKVSFFFWNNSSSRYMVAEENMEFGATVLVPFLVGAVTVLLVVLWWVLRARSMSPTSFGVFSERSRRCREPMGFGGHAEGFREWLFAVEEAIRTLKPEDPVGYAASFLEGNARVNSLFCLAHGCTNSRFIICPCARSEKRPGSEVSFRVLGNICFFALMGRKYDAEVEFTCCHSQKSAKVGFSRGFLSDQIGPDRVVDTSRGQPARCRWEDETMAISCKTMHLVVA